LLKVTKLVCSQLSKRSTGEVLKTAQIDTELGINAVNSAICGPQGMPTEARSFL